MQKFIAPSQTKYSPRSSKPILHRIPIRECRLILGMSRNQRYIYVIKCGSIHLEVYSRFSDGTMQSIVYVFMFRDVYPLWTKRPTKCPKLEHKNITHSVECLLRYWHNLIGPQKSSHMNGWSRTMCGICVDSMVNPPLSIRCAISIMVNKKYLRMRHTDLGTERYIRLHTVYSVVWLLCFNKHCNKHTSFNHYNGVQKRVSTANLARELVWVLAKHKFNHFPPTRRFKSSSWYKRQVKNKPGG